MELTEAGAEHLNRVPSLRSLRLGGVPYGGRISPATPAFRSVRALKSVEDINMLNTRGYTQDQLEGLIRALPRVRIMAGYVHD